MLGGSTKSSCIDFFLCTNKVLFSVGHVMLHFLSSSDTKSCLFYQEYHAKKRPRNTTALPKCSHLGESLSCQIKFRAVLESSHSSEEGFGCVFQYKLLKEKKKTHICFPQEVWGWGVGMHKTHILA